MSSFLAPTPYLGPLSLWTPLHPIRTDIFKPLHHSLNISVAYFEFVVVFKRSDFVTSLKNLRQFGIFHRNRFCISSGNVEVT